MRELKLTDQEREKEREGGGREGEKFPDFSKFYLGRDTPSQYIFFNESELSYKYFWFNNLSVLHILVHACVWVWYLIIFQTKVYYFLTSE